ncbi:MAG: translation elongation factor Ts, partial [bacterium]
MAEISASLVMELRQKTGAKMMDAKRALVDADGNFDKAVELLREKGQADAAKRTHRTTAEGIVLTAQSADHSSAALVELNCETDFVAKTDQFLALAKSLVDYVLSQPAGEITGDNLPEA